MSKPGVNEYSEAEWKLFRAFGFEQKVCDFGHELLAPVFLYEQLVASAFRENLQGAHVEALRRVSVEFCAGKVYRLTPEWDELIRF